MSRRTPVALAVLCAALLAALVVLDRVAPRGERLAASPLFALPARDVEVLDLGYGAARCRLRREGARWRFADLALGRADGAAIDAVLSELELLDRGGLVRAGIPDARHGLRPPRIRIEARAREGRSATLDLGTEASRGRNFAAVGGALYLVPARLSALLGAGCDALIDRRLFALSARTLRSLRVGAVTITRDAGGLRASPPDGALVDEEGLERLVSALNALRAPTPPSPREPLVVATTDDEPRSATLEGASPEGRRITALAEAVLSKAPARLRAANLVRIELRGHGARTLLFRGADDADWRVAADASFDSPPTDAAPAESDAVRAFAARLQGLRARAVVAAGSAPSVEPIAFALRLADDRETRAFEVGPPAGGERALRIEGRAARYVVPSEPFDSLDARPQAWRRRVLWDVPAAAIDALGLGKVELRRDARFRWVRSRPSSGEVSHDDVSALARALAAPRVLRFVDPTSFQPRARLRVETVDGDQRGARVAEIGDPSEGGVLVRTGALVGVLPAPIWREIQRLLVPTE